MRLLPSDPDVETLVSRIKKNEIDLQPDFQRGEVWSEAKKRRLIDTILRDWHIPPIHIIEVRETGKQEVLDGQQRLVAIRDFVNGDIKVDGYANPHDDGIVNLDGLTYEDLPLEWRRRFDRFTIRVFRITDYRPDEPGELFYRLNQPTNLTAAEQRNAFFGPARQQVKELVQSLEIHGINKDFTGFSNSRMAYDDVIARLCFSLEVGTLLEKITAANLANRYRSIEAFPQDVFERAEFSIRMLGESIPYICSDVRFNKATLYSWLWFITHMNQPNSYSVTPEILGSFVNFFEEYRSTRKRSDSVSLPLNHLVQLPPHFIDQLILIYNDRSSARVTDVSSILSRDIVIWLFFLLYLPSQGGYSTPYHQKFNVLLQSLSNIEEDLSRADASSLVEEIIAQHKWGSAV